MYLLLHIRLSICPSVRPHGTPRLHWTDFQEILSNFRKSVDKIQVWLKSDKNNRHFTWRPIHIPLSYLAQFFFEWEMLQTKLYRQSNQIFYSQYIFWQSCPSRDNVEKNIVQPGRPLLTIWRVRIACWIPKATNTYSEYVKLIAFPLQQRLQERASMLR
jgi:hypothetical protein